MADRAAQGAGRPPGAQHIGVVNAGPQPARRPPASSSCRPRSPAPGHRPGRAAGRVGQAEMPGQGGRKEQPGVGHQSAVVEGDLDPVGVLRDRLGAPFLGAVFVLSQKQRSTFLPLQRPSVDSNLYLSIRTEELDSGLRRNDHGLAKAT